MKTRLLIILGVITAVGIMFIFNFDNPTTMPIVESQLQMVTDYCNDTSEVKNSILYYHSNETHSIDNIDCEWKLHQNYPNSEYLCIPYVEKWVTGEEWRNQTHIFDKDSCMWKKDPEYDELNSNGCPQFCPKEPIPEPEIIQETIFDSDKYYEEFGSGSPLIYKSSSKPVLDYDNCKRYAYWLTEHQKEKIDKHEDYPRYPPWGNQIFPLVDFCTANGDFVKLAVGDKLQWSFYEIYSENKPDPESFRSSDPSTKIELSFGEPYQNGLVPVTISEVTIFAEELDEITVWNFELIGHSGDDRYVSWNTLPKEDRIWYQILNDYSEDTKDYSKMQHNLAIPADQHIYELDCGLFQTIEGESAHPTTFPIEKGNYAIIAKNSRMGIFPNSSGEYFFEFASIFPHYVRFPEDSGVEFSSDTKQCSSTWQIDSESGEEHGDGYYTSMTFRFE